MKKHIYRYIYKNYYWLDNYLWVGPNQKTSFKKLSDDLCIIFGLTRKQTKWYIKGWCRYSNKCYDFNTTWDREFKLRAPKKYFIGCDLIDSGVVYSPYIFTTTTPTICENISTRHLIANRYSLYGELDHISRYYSEIKID